jgi:maltooligosyltrehalose synthase
MNRQLHKKAKESDVEGVSALLDEYEDKNALAILAKSEGGQLLTKAALSDVASCVSKLTTTFKDASHAELIAHCASLLASVNMYRALVRAEGNKKQLEELLEQALS